MAEPPRDPVESSRMPLRQHIEELRGCLVRSFLAFVALFSAAMVFEARLRDFILIPWEATRAGILAAGGADPGPLIYIAPAEAFIFSIKLGGGFALLAGAPFYLWQVWRFVGAGLHSNERRAVWRAFPAATGLFVVGLAFGYFVLVEMGLRFLLTYADSAVLVPQVTVTRYFTLLASLTLLMGFVFELPLLMWVVVRAGLVRAATLASSRKVAILGMLVFAAVMTPPDPFTMVLVATPMVVLYELGLLLARSADAAARRAVELDA